MRLYSCRGHLRYFVGQKRLENATDVVTTRRASVSFVNNKNNYYYHRRTLWRIKKYITSANSVGLTSIACVSVFRSFVVMKIFFFPPTKKPDIVFNIRNSELGRVGEC